MKPFQSHLLASATLLSFCGSLLAFEPVQFIAKSGTPESQQWTKDGSLDAPAAVTAGRSVLEVNDDSASDGVAFRRAIDEIVAAEASEAGFALEISGRIEPTEGPSSQRVELGLPNARVVLSLNALKGAQWVGVITPDSDKPVTSQSSDSSFHVWKIVGKPADDGRLLLSLSCDGDRVAADFSPLPGSKPSLVFGAIGANLAERQGHVLYEKVIFRPLEKGDQFRRTRS